jgi:hypothetical protein
VSILQTQAQARASAENSLIRNKKRCKRKKKAGRSKKEGFRQHPNTRAGNTGVQQQHRRGGITAMRPGTRGAGLQEVQEEQGNKLLSEVAGILRRLEVAVSTKVSYTCRWACAVKEELIPQT